MSTHFPIIGLAGTPAWADYVENLLRQHPYELVHYDNPSILINRLIEDYPALLVVDGDDQGWLSWVITPKTEQATRRIPILVIAQGVAREQEALNAGAEACLLLDNLENKLIPQIVAHSRLPDPAVLAELACQCEQDLPSLARLGVEKFNAGAYYAQHDAFEKLWMEEPGPVRDLYRAILQVGVAYYHITRGNYVGGLRMLNRSVQWFWMLPDTCQGVNVRQLREDSARVRAALQAITPADIASFDLSLIKPLRLENE